MRITIIGAGAIGGSAGGYLAAAGHDVLLVDRAADHVAAITEQGLRITGVRGERVVRVKACMPADLTGPLEFVIIAVKGQFTSAALETVVPLLAPHGFVVSMQNGLNEEEIAQAVGAERTLGCLVQYGAYYIGPGHIELGSEHEIYFGELDGQITPRLTMIAEALSAVMPSTPTDNIWGWKWTKLAFGSLNFAGALLDVPLYEALQRRAFRPTFGAVVTEAVRVAYSLGHSRLPTYGTFAPGRLGEGNGPRPGHLPYPRRRPEANQPAIPRGPGGISWGGKGRARRRPEAAAPGERGAHAGSQCPFPAGGTRQDKRARRRGGGWGGGKPRGAAEGGAPGRPSINARAPLAPLFSKNPFREDRMRHCRLRAAGVAVDRAHPRHCAADGSDRQPGPHGVHRA